MKMKFTSKSRVDISEVQIRRWQKTRYVKLQVHTCACTGTYTHSFTVVKAVSMGKGGTSEAY